ncbi:MAG TPA: hypothetical protein VGS10_06930 [Terracidiphilus sp.]|nr:hypothetical protein [Terracidiphilus sp.]
MDPAVRRIIIAQPDGQRVRLAYRLNAGFVPVRKPRWHQLYPTGTALTLP